jgi:hypothetical protein
VVGVDIWEDNFEFVKKSSQTLIFALCQLAPDSPNSHLIVSVTFPHFNILSPK